LGKCFLRLKGRCHHVEYHTILSGGMGILRRRVEALSMLDPPSMFVLLLLTTLVLNLGSIWRLDFVTLPISILSWMFSFLLFRRRVHSRELWVVSLIRRLR
jgi:hypothetical protein